MAAMGNMGVGIPGEAPGVGVDMGGMATPPVPMPAVDPNEMMLQALMAVLGKWEGTEAQLAGEQSTLMETLMMIAGAQPPGAMEAAVMGGDPSGFGMGPELL